MNLVIDRLVASEILESVPADAPAARLWLEDVERHIAAATEIAVLDPSGAYVLAHDAARKGVAAVLLARGYRTLAVPGAHAAVAEAAVSMATDSQERIHLRELDRIRRNRNRSEYSLRTFSSKEVAFAIETAKWIVDFARAMVR